MFSKNFFGISNQRTPFPISFLSIPHHQPEHKGNNNNIVNSTNQMTGIYRKAISTYDFHFEGKQKIKIITMKGVVSANTKNK